MPFYFRFQLNLIKIYQVAFEKNLKNIRKCPDKEIMIKRSDISEYELQILPDVKVSAARGHGKNYMKVKPLLISHFLRYRLL